MGSRDGHINVVKYLAEDHKCSLSVRDCQGLTPIEVASQNKRTEIAEYLQILSKESSEPEMHGESDSDDETLTSLLSNLEHLHGLMHEFVSQVGLPAEALSVLGRDAGLPTDALSMLGGEASLPTDTLSMLGLTVTPLHQACLAGDLNRVKSLVSDEQCDINAKDPDGHTPLHLAAYTGATNIVQYLVSLNNCNAHLADKDGRIALHHASQGGHSNTVAVLLHEGKLSCMAEDKEGTIPLHIAAFNGYVDILRLLAGQKNCDVSHCDRNC